jgi:hypothetical protein
MTRTDTSVFRSLLTFIYSSTRYTRLIAGDRRREEDGDVASERYQRLLAAADMYGLERMKPICQELEVVNAHTRKLRGYDAGFG